MLSIDSTNNMIKLSWFGLWAFLFYYVWESLISRIFGDYHVFVQSLSHVGLRLLYIKLFITMMMISVQFSHCCVWLSVTPWTVAHQGSLSSNRLGKVFLCARLRSSNRTGPWNFTKSKIYFIHIYYSMYFLNDSLWLLCWKTNHNLQCYQISSHS